MNLQEVEEVIYHDEIRDLLFASTVPEEPPSKLPGTRLYSVLTHVGFQRAHGTEADDKTAYHPLCDFSGQEGDRPRILLQFRPCRPTRDPSGPTGILVWAGKVVLDYLNHTIPNFPCLPLTLSSRAEAWLLEAICRWDSRIKLEDILARIVCRGATFADVERMVKRFSMARSRFRKVAREISWEKQPGCDELETYMHSTMTAEMLAKNTTEGLTDVDEHGDEHRYIKTLSMGSAKSRESKTSTKQSKRNELQRKIALCNAAEKWVDSQMALDAETTHPQPSTYEPLEPDAMESRVAWKLASMIQQDCNGDVVFGDHAEIPNAPPATHTGFDELENFFICSPSVENNEQAVRAVHNSNSLLSQPPLNNLHQCIIYHLLEETREDFVAMAPRVTLPTIPHIPLTNNKESYIAQYRKMQTQFNLLWRAKVKNWEGYMLRGLVSMSSTTMTWNCKAVEVTRLRTVEVDMQRSKNTLARSQQAYRQSEKDRLQKLMEMLKGKVDSVTNTNTEDNAGGIHDGSAGVGGEGGTMEVDEENDEEGDEKS